MPYIASMGIYVVGKDVMTNLLRDQFPGANDFGSEVIPGATSIGLRACTLSSISSTNSCLCSYELHKILHFPFLFGLATVMYLVKLIYIFSIL